jgi:hypothetical protein
MRGARAAISHLNRRYAVSFFGMLLSFETGSASDDHPQVPTVICPRGEPAKANAQSATFSRHAINRVCATLPTASPGAEWPVAGDIGAADVLGLLPKWYPLVQSGINGKRDRLAGSASPRKCCATPERPHPRRLPDRKKSRRVTAARPEWGIVNRQ